MGATTRAMVCTAFGPPETLVLQEVKAAEPGPGQVAVAIRAIGLNFTDLLAIEGRSQLKRKPPIIPGTEASGIIEAIGPGVAGFQVGQRVIATCVHGAYTERGLFEAEAIYPMPDEMDFATAATFYIASMTSFHALVDRAKIRAGENLLVIGAGSGAGLSAIGIAKAIGARVVGAASSQDKLDVARKHGADHVLLYPREPLDFDGQKAFYAALQAASGEAPETSAVSLGTMSTLSKGAGFDVVYDAVGGTYAEPALRAMAWEGRYLSVGFSAGVPALSLGPLLFKNADIMGIQPAADDYRLPGRNPRVIEQMFAWFRSGHLRPEITERYPLDQAGTALSRMKNRQAKGRIVLTVGEDAA